MDLNEEVLGLTKRRADMCMGMRTVVCDDNEEVRLRMRSYLQSYGNVEVVAEVDNRDILMSIIQETSPELLMVNWMMNSICLKSLISLVKKINPAIKILFFSADENYHEILECIDSGFFANICMSNELVTKLFNHGERDSIAFTDKLFLKDFSLSNRELEVLKLVASGKSNFQISKELYISLATTKTHIRSILGKLGVVDRTQAAIKAIKFGIEPDMSSVLVRGLFTNVQVQC